MITLKDRYAFFRKHSGGIVGESAVYAIGLARAEEAAANRGLECKWEDENEPWDGECEPPAYLLWAYVPDLEGSRVPLASLGMIGVESLDDPYLRVVAAELYVEALEAIDAADEQEAEHLCKRATYAG